MVGLQLMEKINQCEILVGPFHKKLSTLTIEATLLSLQQYYIIWLLIS